MSPRPSGAAIAVENRLFRALAVLRGIVLVNAVALNVYRADNFERPGLAATLVGVMVAWTGFAIWAYAGPQRRPFPLLAADLGLAVVMLAATPLLKGSDFNASLPGFWVIGALCAWAIHYRWKGGLIAGGVLAVVDFVVRPDFDQTEYGHAFLLVIGGPIIGYMCGSLQQMAAERDLAERAAATANERARLGRAVHDGVLQVLSLVQRQGHDLGGAGDDLARLAGQQERELRALIRAQDAVATEPRTGSVDLVSELDQLQLEYPVTVSTPGEPVRIPVETGHEITAAVRACLDNVRRHVGDEAPAWVLLQALPDRVEVSVRDDGPGIPDGRLREAADDGRLGIVESIRGRISDLGGTAELMPGPGTEWEFMIPLRSES